MRRAMSREDGMATLELGVVLPTLLLLLTIVIPVVHAGWQYMVATRAAAHGVRYATRADTNVRMSPSGFLTRRPTAVEVEGFVRDAARPIELGAVTVEPEPAGSLPGDLITVRTSFAVEFGPLADIANGVTSAFFGGRMLLPESKQITVTARGREE